jgi:hypothetical protein
VFDALDSRTLGTMPRMVSSGWCGRFAQGGLTALPDKPQPDADYGLDTAAVRVGPEA